MEKKMCKYFAKHWPNCIADGLKCQKGTNMCEIITKKKVRRVKAWINFWGDKNEWFSTEQWEGPDHKIPCTILIDEKWLKEKK